MRAFTARDLDTMLGFLADDVVVEMPYEAHGYSTLDKAGFRSVLELVLAMYERFEIEFERVFELDGSEGVVAEYRSDAVLAGSGVEYRNRYCGVFLVRDGLVTHWREYHDPTVVERSMAAHAAATS
jgi:ketosteroid isomerase-like protein